MRELNLPKADLKINTTERTETIFDIIRKRNVRLTKEEWVRQHFLHFLIHHLQTPPSLIAVETTILVNGLTKRCDIVVYNRSASPILIVECKAPEVAITQEVFDQVARYNMTLVVPFLIVTNGLDHYSCYIDHDKRSYTFLKEIPTYSTMVGEGLHP